LECALRLVAWNCCMGPLAKKLGALETLSADVAVIPECPRLPNQSDAILWFGSNPRKGVGVITRPPWRIAETADRGDLPRYVRLIQIEGPEPFLLWAVWACNDGPDRYVRGIHRAVTLYADLVRSIPNVMLGDFNSNSIWDSEHPEGLSHSALVRKLGSLGLASAYHIHHGEQHGAETTPTFFEYRHQHRPYHIDYCFLPQAWAPRIATVRIGRHSEWSPLSDHMPLTTELCPRAV
jgi:exonuclease III